MKRFLFSFVFSFFFLKQVLASGFLCEGFNVEDNFKYTISIDVPSVIEIQNSDELQNWNLSLHHQETDTILHLLSKNIVRTTIAIYEGSTRIEEYFYIFNYKDYQRHGTISGFTNPSFKSLQILKIDKDKNFEMYDGFHQELIKGTCK